MKQTLRLLVALAGLCIPQVATDAGAQGLEGEGGAEADAESSGGERRAARNRRTRSDQRKAERRRAKRRDQRWMVRWAPEPRMGEWGLYSGLYQAGRFGGLLQPDLDDAGQPLPSPRGSIGELGIRLGRYPSRFFGMELEAGTVLPRASAIEDPTHFSGRGSVVFQVGKWTLTPFVLAGAGVFGVRRDRNIDQQSLDVMIHAGGGLKLFLSRSTQLRVDMRDVVAYLHRQGGAYRNVGLVGMLSLSVTPGRAWP